MTANTSVGDICTVLCRARIIKISLISNLKENERLNVALLYLCSTYLIHFMAQYQYPSGIFEQAVREFSKLPGIGNKTALRLVLHLLKQPKEELKNLGQTLIDLSEKIHYCTSCNNISEEEVCPICSDMSRDHSTVCLVENVRDVLAIENTRQYHGIYHVLGCIISPMEGIGPSDLQLSSLENKLQQGKIKEIILALPATVEGDTTGFYLYRRFQNFHVNMTTLARGIPAGGDLEYTDEITLARSIINRTPFQIGNQ